MEGEHGERAREIVIYSTVINTTAVGSTDKFRRLSLDYELGSDRTIRTVLVEQVSLSSSLQKIGDVTTLLDY